MSQIPRASWGSALSCCPLSSRLCYIRLVPTAALKTKTTTLRFTEEDRALLDVLTEKEDRSAGAILRLALRAYAAAQGVTTESKPKLKAKRKNT